MKAVILLFIVLFNAQSFADTESALICKEQIRKCVVQRLENFPTVFEEHQRERYDFNEYRLLAEYLDAEDFKDAWFPEYYSGYYYVRDYQGWNFFNNAWEYYLMNFLKRVWNIDELPGELRERFSKYFSSQCLHEFVQCRENKSGSSLSGTVRESKGSMAPISRPHEIEECRDEPADLSSSYEE